MVRSIPPTHTRVARGLWGRLVGPALLGFLVALMLGTPVVGTHGGTIQEVTEYEDISDSGDWDMTCSGGGPFGPYHGGDCGYAYAPNHYIQFGRSVSHVRVRVSLGHWAYGGDVLIAVENYCGRAEMRVSTGTLEIGEDYFEVTPWLVAPTCSQSGTGYTIIIVGHDYDQGGYAGTALDYVEYDGIHPAPTSTPTPTLCAP